MADVDRVAEHTQELLDYLKDCTDIKNTELWAFKQKTLVALARYLAYYRKSIFSAYPPRIAKIVLSQLISLCGHYAQIYSLSNEQVERLDSILSDFLAYLVLLKRTKKLTKENFSENIAESLYRRLNLSHNQVVGSPYFWALVKKTSCVRSSINTIEHLATQRFVSSAKTLEVTLTEISRSRFTARELERISCVVICGLSPEWRYFLDHPISFEDFLSKKYFRIVGLHNTGQSVKKDINLSQIYDLDTALSQKATAWLDPELKIIEAKKLLAGLTEFQISSLRHYFSKNDS